MKVVSAGNELHYFTEFDIDSEYVTFFEKNRGQKIFLSIFVL
jgi:hypothetical protein